MGEHLNHILMFKSSFREKYGFSMRKPTNWEPFMILFQFYSLNELGKSKDLDQNQLFQKLKSIFISVNIDPESRVSNPLWNLNFKWHIYIATPKKAPS